MTVAACACNALTGANDLELDPGGTAPVPEEGGSIDGGPPPADGPIDVVPPTDSPITDGPVTRPTYCNGVTLYLRLDGTTQSAQGDTPALAIAETFGAGKFKGAFDFDTAKTLVYAATPPTGTKRFDINVGTLSLWFKPRWAFPGTATRTFMRPQDVVDASNGAEPALRLDNAAAQKSLGVEGPGATEATATVAAVTPSWKNLDWNHLVGTWQRTGSPTTLSFTLNGGGGDGGVARVTSAMAWTPMVAGTFFRLNSGTSTIDGLVDDVAVWSRQLTAVEVAALYADGIAGRALGDVCALP